MTGPNGTAVKGSPFAAERGRYYTGRGRGFRRGGGGFRRGPPRAEGQYDSQRGFSRGRGRPFFRRRFFRQDNPHAVGQEEPSQEQAGSFENGAAGYDRRGGGRPRRYIQRFFRRQQRRPRGEGEVEAGGVSGALSAQH